MEIDHPWHTTDEDRQNSNGNRRNPKGEPYVEFEKMEVN